jgi:hypothetical protein
LRSSLTVGGTRISEQTANTPHAVASTAVNVPRSHEAGQLARRRRSDRTAASGLAAASRESQAPPHLRPSRAQLGT